MRGSIKIGKEQYWAVNSGTKAQMKQASLDWIATGNKYVIRLGRGVFSKKYILYVLPKKPKR